MGKACSTNREEKKGIYIGYWWETRRRETTRETKM
jgi:hypothetical protein